MGGNVYLNLSSETSDKPQHGKACYLHSVNNKDNQPDYELSKISVIVVCFLLVEQSDQGLHCLLFHLHLLTKYCLLANFCQYIYKLLYRE